MNNKFMTAIKFSPGLCAFLIVFVFMLSGAGSLFATATLNSITTLPSAACGSAGATVTVTMVMTEATAWQPDNVAVILSATNATNPWNGNWVVGGSGTSCQAGTLAFTAGATVPQTFTWTGTFVVPAGTFNYIIAAVHTGNMYNCGQDSSSIIVNPFTASCSGGASPTPTGVQNKADSDASTTNAVGLIVFSPTPTLSKTITVSPTLTVTTSPTATPSITVSLTWTLTPTLTWTLSVTLTPTLTFTLTPPVVIALTKTIDKHIFSLGDQVNYCLVYTNNGTANANFTIWDTIPLVTDFVSCTNGCSQVTYGSYLVLVWNISGLGVGQSSQVCFVVQVNRLPYIQDGKEYFALFDERKYPEYAYMKEDLYTGEKYNMNWNGFLRHNP